MEGIVDQYCKGKVGVVSFVMDDAAPARYGNSTGYRGNSRAGWPSLRQPLMQFYNVPAAVRASLAFYNTRAEMDALVKGIRKVRGVQIMSELRELYQGILDHNKNPRNFGPSKGATCSRRATTRCVAIIYISICGWWKVGSRILALKSRGVLSPKAFLL